MDLISRLNLIAKISGILILVFSFIFIVYLGCWVVKEWNRLSVLETEEE